MKTRILIVLIIFAASLFSCGTEKKLSEVSSNSADEKIKEWEGLRFGAFVSFNDNTSLEDEFTKNTDAAKFNPINLDFDAMMSEFQKAGVKYAVLTARHTSGFCLWHSKVSEFNVGNSPFKKDVVKLFVDACRKYDIKPCLYYCLWGSKDYQPWEWNPVLKKELNGSTPKEIIKKQLTELAENYGEIFEFWLDMYCWCDPNLTTQEIYNLLKEKNPNTIVHFNQHVQDGTQITYFPTDILNGEERTPPPDGHKPDRQVGTKTYHMPFEYEITSQRCDNRSIEHGLMKGSVWFTYTDSKFYPVDSLFRYVKQNFDRGGSCILLSTAPDKTGTYRQADSDSLAKLGKMIWKYWKK
jgi:alpha-L-fucosidase